MDRLTSKSPGKTGSIPLFIVLICGGIAAGLLFAAFQQESSFRLAFSNAVLLVSFLLFGVSWILYLKKDGVRFFQPRRKNPLNQSTSWLDRTGVPGEVPQAPSPIPDTSGPDSEAYQKLSEAEQKLRMRLLGLNGQENEPNQAVKTSASLKNSLIAGIFLLLTGLALQYLLKF